MSKTAERKAYVGEIVHVFIREIAAFYPHGLGPYPFIVTEVYSDGRIAGTGFPMEVAGSLNRVPFNDGKGNKDVAEWYQFIELK